MDLVEHAQGADLERFGETETAPFIGADRAGAGADVRDQCGGLEKTVFARDLAGNRNEIQPCLIRAGEKLDLDARGMTDPFEENIGIGGFAHGAGGDRLAAGHAVFAHLFPEIGQHVAQELDGFIADLAVAEHIGTEGHGPFQLFQRSEFERPAVDLGDEQPGGMRPHVDRRHRHHPGVLIRRVLFFRFSGHRSFLSADFVTYFRGKAFASRFRRIFDFFREKI